MLHEKLLGSVQILYIDFPVLKEALIKAARKIRNDHKSILKILLFGSFAKGNYTPLSDIDILIVVESTDTPFLNRKEAYHCYFPVPFDVNILVYTAREYDNMLSSGNLFLSSILQHAVDL